MKMSCKIFASANAMILENSLLIKEISEKLGFRGEYYFNRFFFKMAGISPGKYRNQHIWPDLLPDLRIISPQ